MIDPASEIEDFWDNIHVTNTGCWLWAGHITPQGYGVIRYRPKNIKHKVSAFAHRFSYEFFYRPIPKKRVIDHLCQKTRCVNPGHLEAVTRSENIRRAFALKKKEGANFTPSTVKRTNRKQAHPFSLTRSKT